ncbi:MAG: endonuclease/exonuclease/phosphatase family protein, partial [Luteitalea sp.]
RQAADPAERLLLVGDFNAFEFSDGYVDVVGTIVGDPVPAEQVVVPSSDLVDPNLVNLVNWVPPAERYSYLFEGNAQVLDHALATQNLTRLVSRVSFSRSNADQPEIARGVADSPARLSDHDGIVVAFATGAPRVVAQVAGRSAGAATVDVRFINAGAGNAFDVVVDSVAFRTLAGTGTVTLAGPALPLSLGVLAPGSGVTRTLQLNVPATVTRFAIAEGGAYQTAAGAAQRFSSTQAVIK